MVETPSKRRRRGREAYLPGEEPMDHQPYKVGSYAYEVYLKDFLDGWYEEEQNWKREEEEKQGVHICECCGQVIK